MKQKTLVTGGSGFIGAALCRKLLSHGHKVVSFDNNFRNENLSAGYSHDLQVVQADIRDHAALKEASSGCDAIFHLAFINGTRHFYEQPKLVLDVGVRGMLSVLEAVEKNKVASLILASSSEVYQSPDLIPTPETERAIIPDVKNPRFCYSGGKLISEIMTLNYLRESRTREIVFRPHNVYGPSMGFEHVIPEIMLKLSIASLKWSKKSVQIEIQGDGTETRAFCYIDDAISQIMAVFTHGKKGEIYHIGIQQEITILSLIKKIGTILDLEIDVSFGPKRSGGTNRRCPDISKVRKLGYIPPKKNYYGLEKTVRWYQEHLK